MFCISMRANTSNVDTARRMASLKPFGAGGNIKSVFTIIFPSPSPLHPFSPWHRNCVIEFWFLTSVFSALMF